MTSEDLDSAGRQQATAGQRVRGRSLWRRLAPWAALAVFMGWTLIPAFWVLTGAFKSPSDIYSFSILPTRPTLEGWAIIFDIAGFWRYAQNSFIVAATTTIITIVISVFAGYGFARYAFKWRHLLLVLVVVPRMIPQVSLITPLFELLRSVGLIDSYLGLILTHAALNVPFATWIMTGFIASIPLDLEEAAAVDGGSFLGRLGRIVLPLAMPGILMAGTLTFVVSWNEFPFVLAFTFSGEMRTLPFALFQLRESMGIPHWGAVNAFVVASVLPLMVMFGFFQKYVVGGLTQGAVK